MSHVTRRHFVTWAAIGVGAVGVGLTAWRTRGYQVETAITKQLQLFAPWQYLVVQTVGARIVHPQSVNVGLFADAYLAGLPAADLRDVRALIGFVEHGAPLLTGRFHRFTALELTAQDEVLRAIEQHRVGRVRAGFNVLKAVAFMALYERDSSWPAIGYPGPLVPQGAS